MPIFEATEPAAAARVASIHTSAFATNAMLLAQFPTPTIRANLQICIARKTAVDIRDPKTVVLVVRDQNSKFSNGDGDDEIISFAKWHLPVLEGERYEGEPKWVWPEGTEMGVLEGWVGRVEEAKARVVGDGGGGGLLS